ncbi:hypothetical protein KRX56_05680 [Dermabacteraceae bacterium TAE3-ERU27]|nr:hypothetical protein [Dermabacteraceae bacterium TAE3-ERU27]
MSRPALYGLDRAWLRKVRLIWAAILAVPLLLLSALALKFFSMFVIAHLVVDDYAQKELPAAQERNDSLFFANWFEPYLADYNRGTILLREGKLEQAESSLRAALQNWESSHDLNQPPHAECKIKINLALTLEKKSDDIADAKQRASVLEEAKKLIEPCGNSGDGGKGRGNGKGKGGGQGNKQKGEGQGNENQREGESAKKRIEEKKRQADREAGNPEEKPGSDKSKNKDENEGQDGSKGEQPGQGGPLEPGDQRRRDPGAQGNERQSADDQRGDQRKEDRVEERQKGREDGNGGSKPW